MLNLLVSALSTLPLCDQGRSVHLLTNTSVSTCTLRFILSYLYRDNTPLFFLLHLQSQMIISMVFPFMKTMIPEDPHWSKVSSSYFSVSLHISLDPVSSSFKYLLSALSLLDIRVPDFSIRTSSLFKRIIMFLPPVSTF